MLWAASFEARLENPPEDLADLVDELLSILAERPGVLGAVTFANLDERTVGSRFDIEQPDARAAFHAATNAFTGALGAIGFDDTAVDLISVEIADAEVMLRHDREREPATT